MGNKNAREESQISLSFGLNFETDGSLGLNIKTWQRFRKKSLNFPPRYTLFFLPPVFTDHISNNKVI